MVDVATTLKIIGAAEGSWFNTKDLRYTPSFANANSGLSFGVFQFDVAVNAQGKAGLSGILKTAVSSKTIDQVTSSRIYADAAKRNAKAFMKTADVTTVTKLLNLPASKLAINTLDNQRAVTEGGQIDAMIVSAAAFWRGKKITSAVIFTLGQANYLHLFAYLLANLNRFPDNKATFQSWLGGQKIVTAGAPPGGFQLSGPPSIDQMHSFFKSLRIWDGTQGNYQYLRDRLDPVLPKPTT